MNPFDSMLFNREKERNWLKLQYLLNLKLKSWSNLKLKRKSFVDLHSIIPDIKLCKHKYIWKYNIYSILKFWFNSIYIEIYLVVCMRVFVRKSRERNDA